MDEQNPTPDAGGASTQTPEERLAAMFLAQEQSSENDEQDESKDPQAQPDKPDDGEPAKDQEPQITTALLAQYLGIDESEIDVDEDGAPVFKTKIDGKESTAKFSDFRQHYQKQGHADNQMRAAAERERAVQAREQEAERAIQAKLQQFDQGLQQVDALAKAASDEMARDFQQIDWNSLRQQSPEQYAALRLDFQERASRIQAVTVNAHQQRVQAMQAAEQQRAKLQSETLAAEGRKVMELIPEWNDGEVRAREQAAIREWAIQSGFPKEEVDTVSRAYHVLALRGAWQNATLQKAKPEIENKVRTAPRLVKPGQSTGKDAQQTAKSVQVKSLKAQVKQSGGKNDKAFVEYLLATGQA